MFINYSNTVSFVFHMYITTFLPYSVCRHNIQMVYLNDHGYDTDGGII